MADAVRSLVVAIDNDPSCDGDVRAALEATFQDATSLEITLAISQAINSID